MIGVLKYSIGYCTGRNIVNNKIYLNIGYYFLMGLLFRGKLFLNEYIYLYCISINVFRCVFNFIRVVGNFY